MPCGVNENWGETLIKREIRKLLDFKMNSSPTNVHSEIALKGDDYELNMSTTTEFSSQHQRIHGNGTNLCSLRIL